MKNFYDIVEQYEKNMKEKCSEIEQQAKQKVIQKANENTIINQDNQVNELEEQLITYKNVESNCRGNFLLFCVRQCGSHNSKKILLNLSSQLSFYLTFVYIKRRDSNNSQFYRGCELLEYIGGG
ncbi:unnamed protein product [Paramecium sonneborni]|uniref:Uncharacterized protein n=1 Tax=Paramecium sonneborni TaxID=65129 RepID=A0A8S1QHW8_9CILI|nr:unnamed protein product [Paramecium sonneborni]